MFCLLAVLAVTVAASSAQDSNVLLSQQYGAGGRENILLLQPGLNTLDDNSFQRGFSNVGRAPVFLGQPAQNFEFDGVNRAEQARAFQGRPGAQVGLGSFSGSNSFAGQQIGFGQDFSNTGFTGQQQVLGQNLFGGQQQQQQQQQQQRQQQQGFGPRFGDVTLTQTRTLDRYVTSTALVFNSLPVTLTQFDRRVITRTTRQVVPTPVNDLVRITSAVIRSTTTVTVNHVNTAINYVTRTTSDVYPVTHTIYDIFPTTTTSVITLRNVVTSTVVHTNIVTNSVTVTDRRYVTDYHYVANHYY